MEGFYLHYQGSPKGAAPLSAKDYGRNVRMYFEYRAPTASRAGWVRYYLFYPGDKIPTGVTPLFGHQGDWEAYAVRLGPTGDATAVGYQAHGAWSKQSLQSATRVSDGLGTHAWVYVANGSHATYSTPGWHGLDRTSNGVHWPTWREATFVDVKAAPWYGFGGAWGNVGIDTHTTGPLGPGRNLMQSVPPEWLVRG